MNREIKFRAWDGKEIINWNDLLHKDSFPYIMNEQTNVMLIQYTWLKDKNNNEIYEGDIVEMEATEENTQFPNNCFIAEVFINHKWVLLSQWNAKQIVQPQKDWLKWDWVDCWWYILWSNMNIKEEIDGGNYICRIIWNIYENPDLLTK